MSSILLSQNITYSYLNGPSFHYPDLELHSGDIQVIIGKSGSGKSTFLNLLAGFLEPHTGKLNINQTEINQLNELQKDKFRGKNIGFIFQKNYFIHSLNIRENIRWASYSINQKPDNKWIETLCDMLQIPDLLDKMPNRLSQGEAQRASIVRAMANKPALLLADEPTSSLDDENTEYVSELLKKIAQEGPTSLLIVTHDKRLKDAFDGVPIMFNPVKKD